MKSVRIETIPETNSGKRVGWFKLLKNINKKEKFGYAYEGEFLNTGEHDIELHSVIIECYHCGSVRNGWKEGRLFYINENGMNLFEDDGKSSFNWTSEALSLRDAAEALLKTAEKIRNAKSKPNKKDYWKKKQAERKKRLEKLGRKKASIWLPNHTQKEIEALKTSLDTKRDMVIELAIMHYFEHITGCNNITEFQLQSAQQQEIKTPEKTSEICPTCEGMGEVDDKTCDKCNGEGWT